MTDVNTIKFAKVRESAIIPTQEGGSAGYDIYANFEEDCLIINPLQTVMVPTGIASAFSEEFFFQIEERGSTGTRGMAKRAGVFDSNYRGEWFIPITNVTNFPIVIAKKGVTMQEVFGVVTPNNVEFYPYDKAIAQAVFLPVPKTKTEEISFEELKKIPSDRGDGKLGSTGK